VIACLALREEQDHGAPLTVADGVKLRVQPALLRPMQRGRAPFCAGWQRCDAP
jgi:hypothetical protein